MASRGGLRKFEDFRLSCVKCGIALSWQGGSEEKESAPAASDLDLQAIAFDAGGGTLDAVYYNNLKALGRGLTHTGDETTGDRSGFAEVVFVNLTKMPTAAQMVVFVVASYRGGRINDVKGVKFHVLKENTSTELGSFGLERLAAQAAVIGCVFRHKEGGWSIRVMEEQAADGQHFVDIMEPTIGDVVRQFIPSAPRRIKASFAMDKGSTVDLPKTSTYRGRRTCAGLSWDSRAEDVDLDVSAVMIDPKGQEVGAVFFGNEEAQGIRHSGDNQGEDAATADNEVITLDFEALPRDVHQIFFVINVYSKDKTFERIAGARCRMFATGCTEEMEEFCHYRLTEAVDQQALIMARLFREPDGVRWGFQAIGVPAHGRTYKDTLPRVMELAKLDARGGAAAAAAPAARSDVDGGEGLEVERTASAHAAAAGCPTPHELLDKPPMETLPGPQGLHDPAPKNMSTGAGCCGSAAPPGPQRVSSGVIIESGAREQSCGKGCSVQ